MIKYGHFHGYFRPVGTSLGWIFRTGPWKLADCELKWDYSYWFSVLDEKNVSTFLLTYIFFGHINSAYVINTNIYWYKFIINTKIHTFSITDINTHGCMQKPQWSEPQLSEILSVLGIMGSNLGPPWNPSDITSPSNGPPSMPSICFSDISNLSFINCRYKNMTI